MRDGVRLAFDIYRPGARRRASSTAASRRSCSTRRTTRPTSATREIADFFVPKGYNVVLHRPARPLPLRGLGRLLPRRHAAHRARRLRHLRVDRGPAVVERPDRHRRQLLRRDHAGAHGARAAAAPDGDLARRRAHEQLPEPVPRGRRDAAAHVLGALHPRPGRAGRARRPGASRRRSGTTCANLRQLFQATPWQRGQTALRHVPPLEETLIDYCTRGAYDEYWSRIEHDYTRYWDQHADIPATFSTGWYDPFPAADSEYFASMAAQEHGPAAPRHRPVEPRRHARRRRPSATTSTSGRERLGRRSATSRSSSRSSTAGCRTTRPAAPEDEAPVRIFVMGGGSGRRPRRASSTTAAAGATSRSGRSRARVPTTSTCTATARCVAEPPPAGAEPRRFTFDPADPVPTIGGLYCAVGELPAEGAGMEQAWMRAS